jgi:hypothetical protein
VTQRWADRSVEDLRRAALSALGQHADERARDAVAHAAITVVDGAKRWVGSGGPVEAHRVFVALDARRLGALRAAPGVTDALCVAFAAAVATHQGEALLDLVFAWDREARASAVGYRDSPPDAPRASVRDALVDYLDARGELALARSLGDVELEPKDVGGATLRVDGPTRDALRADARGLAAVTAALRDLLGDAAARVRLR